MTTIQTFGYRIEIQLSMDDLAKFQRTGYLAFPDPIIDGKAILLKGGRHYTPEPNRSRGTEISAICSILMAGLNAFEQGESRTWEKAHEDEDYFIRITTQ